MSKKFFKKSSVFYLNTFLSVVAILFVINVLGLPGHLLIKRAMATVAGIAGEGTVNYVARFATGANPSNSIGDSIIYDDGTNIGIGTTSPGAKLTLQDGTFRIGDTAGGSAASFSYSAGKLQIGLDSAGTDGIYFREYIPTTGYANHMVIKNTGNVGIGTTSPAAVLNTKPANVMVTAIGNSVSNSSAYFESGANTWGLAVGYEGNAGSGMVLQTVDKAQTTGGKILLNPYGGNVGIGTTAPGNLLTVNQSGNTTAATVGTYGLAVNISGSQQITLGSDATYAYLQSWNAKPLYINSQGNNVIFGSGNVGIGTTAPGQSLDVNGNIRSRGGNWQSYTGSAYVAAYYDALSHRFDVSGTPTMTIDTNRAITLGSTGGSGGSNTATAYTRVAGMGVPYSGGGTFGAYGALVLHSAGAWTGGERRWMITNAYMYGTKFAIIRSTAWNVDPAIGTDGVISSGTADFVISNGGSVSMPGDVTTGTETTGTLYFTGGSSITTDGISRLNLNATGYTYIPNGVFYVGGMSHLRGGIDNDNATYLTIAGGTSGYTYFSGNVGIGTTAPAQKLDVNGAMVLTPLASDPSGLTNGTMWMRQ